VKVSACHVKHAAGTEHLFSPDQRNTARQAWPREEQTQEVVGNIFNMKHFAARSTTKGMIFVTSIKQYVKFFYIAAV
jgi:hypothetical protein